MTFFASNASSSPRSWLAWGAAAVVLCAPLAAAHAQPGKAAAPGVAVPATAAATLVAAQSSLGFAITQMGVPVQGSFRKFDATVHFDPARPTTGRIALAVDVGSATLGSREADAEMPKPVWFNAVQFPQARFQSTAIRPLGGGRFEVVGNLSIKGASREVVAPVTLTQTGAGTALTTVASGTLFIPRLAFKVGEAEWADTSLVADAVQIQFKLALAGISKL